MVFPLTEIPEFVRPVAFTLFVALKVYVGIEPKLAVALTVSFILLEALKLFKLPAGVVNVTVSLPLDTVIVIVAEINLVGAKLSVAVIVTEDVPVDVAVPDNVPFMELRVRPVGKLVEE